MKQSDMNHLRRLLGWIRCEIEQPPAEQQRTMISIAEKLGECGIDPDAKARLVEGYRRAEAVPVYVRDAVNALEKLLPAPGRGPGAEGPRATAETRVNIGFDPGAPAGRAPHRPMSLGAILAEYNKGCGNTVGTGSEHCPECVAAFVRALEALNVRQECVPVGDAQEAFVSWWNAQDEGSIRFDLAQYPDDLKSTFNNLWNEAWRVALAGHTQEGETC